MKTGRLRDSIRSESDGDSATVSSDVAYAQHVEFGTTEAAPHPYLVPAAEEERPKFEQRVRRALRNATE